MPLSPLRWPHSIGDSWYLVLMMVVLASISYKHFEVKHEQQMDRFIALTPFHYSHLMSCAMSDAIGITNGVRVGFVWYTIIMDHVAMRSTNVMSPLSSNIINKLQNASVIAICYNSRLPESFRVLDQLINSIIGHMGHDRFALMIVSLATTSMSHLIVPPVSGLQLSELFGADFRSVTSLPPMNTSSSEVKTTGAGTPTRLLRAAGGGGTSSSSPTSSPITSTTKAFPLDNKTTTKSNIRVSGGTRSGLTTSGNESKNSSGGHKRSASGRLIPDLPDVPLIADEMIAYDRNAIITCTVDELVCDCIRKAITIRQINASIRRRIAAQRAVAAANDHDDVVDSSISDYDDIDDDNDVYDDDKSPSTIKRRQIPTKQLSSSKTLNPQRKGSFDTPPSDTDVKRDHHGQSQAQLLHQQNGQLQYWSLIMIGIIIILIVFLLRYHRSSADDRMMATKSVGI
jgi:hypothetical protein